MSKAPEDVELGRVRVAAGVCPFCGAETTPVAADLGIGPIAEELEDHVEEEHVDELEELSAGAPIDEIAPFGEEWSP